LQAQDSVALRQQQRRVIRVSADKVATGSAGRNNGRDIRRQVDLDNITAIRVGENEPREGPEAQRDTIWPVGKHATVVNKRTGKGAVSKNMTGELTARVHSCAINHLTIRADCYSVQPGVDRHVHRVEYRIDFVDLIIPDRGNEQMTGDRVGGDSRGRSLG
jgi:hypothetical protein